MKTAIRVFCLIAVTFGMYRADIESALAFLGLMIVVFWAIPEIICYLFKEDDEE